MITPAMADAYFATHLDGDDWMNLPEETMRAVLAMAERQVAAELQVAAVDPASEFQLYAVCEQAVFLSRNHARMKEGKIITSQSLDGVGSQSYKILNDGNATLSVIAANFIKQALNAMRPGRSFRYGRG